MYRVAGEGENYVMVCIYFVRIVYSCFFFNCVMVCIYFVRSVYSTVNFVLTVCVRNDLGRPTFQSDSFLTHAFSTLDYFIMLQIRPTF